jgi:AcrR family transcriptional regulator
MDTRARILAAALELFTAHGYQRTSLRQIAERLGITKAAVLYHFPAKDRIMGELVEPMLCDLEAALDGAERLAPEAARWAALEGMLDAFLAHRPMLQTLRHDLAIISRAPIYQRFLAVATRAGLVIAGPGADLAGRVRAVQAMAGLGDPLFYFADAPGEVLREMILDGARRILDDPGPARSGGTRRPGRPRALDAERLAAAHRMHVAGGYSVAQIAAALGVSRATLYRHLKRPDGPPLLSQNDDVLKT